MAKTNFQKRFTRNSKILSLKSVFVILVVDQCGPQRLWHPARRLPSSGIKRTVTRLMNTRSACRETMGKPFITFHVFCNVPLVLALRSFRNFQKQNITVVPNLLPSETQDLNSSERVKFTDHTKSFMWLNNSRLFSKKCISESLTSGKAGWRASRFTPFRSLPARVCRDQANGGSLQSRADSNFLILFCFLRVSFKEHLILHSETSDIVLPLEKMNVGAHYSQFHFSRVSSRL